MHQMAFKLRDVKILSTFGFKLIVDYSVSARKLSILQVRGTKFDCSVGEISTPRPFGKERDQDDDDGDDFMQSANKLLGGFKKSVRRTTDKDSIRVGPPSASSKPKPKKRPVDGEDRTAVEPSLTEWKKTQTQARKRPRVKATVGPIAGDQVILDKEAGALRDSPADGVAADDVPAEDDGDPDSGDDSGSEGDTSPNTKGLDAARRSWLHLLDVEDPAGDITGEGSDESGSLSQLPNGRAFCLDLASSGNSF